MSKFNENNFFGPQMNSYKWYILIDEEGRERYSKYETKDFNCLIEMCQYIDFISF